MWTFAQIQEKRRERKAIYDKAVACSKAAQDEKRSLTAEEESKMNSMLDQVESMGKEIELAERAFGLGQGLSDATDILKDARSRQGEGQGQAEDKEQNAKYSQAFKRFLQVGLERLDPESRSLVEASYRQLEGRDLGTGSGAAGGYTVPSDFMKALEVAMKYYGPMLDLATPISTDNGAPLPMPTLNDTGSSGEQIDENAEATLDTGAAPFGSKLLGAFIYSSKILPVSLALLNDSAFDESYIINLLGERLGRILNTRFTLGSGVGQPQGIVVGATSGKVGVVGQTLTVTYDDLVDLKHSVDVAYRNSPKCGFMMNDATIAVVSKLKDTTGKPIWQPAIEANRPDTLLGKPLYVNNDMAVMAANAKSILFGDLGKYTFRRVRAMQILRLAERYAEKLQVGFLGFVRADGALLDAGAHPVKYYANSAT